MKERGWKRGLLKANPFLIVVVLFSSLLSNFAFSQVMSRFATIQYLADIEERFVGLAKSEIERYEQELKILKDYVEDYKESTQRHLDGLNDKTTPSEEPPTEKDIEAETRNRINAIASSPILVYKLSHRLVTKFPRLQKLLLRKNPTGFQLRETLAYFANPLEKDDENIDLESFGEQFGIYNGYFPTYQDLEETLEALAILYDTHEPIVNPENFASTFSSETTTPVSFDAEHSLKISLKAFYDGLYASAIDWITLAEEAIDNDRDYSVSKELVQYTRQFMIKTHNTELSKTVGNFSTKSYFALFETPLPTDPLFAIHNRSELKTRRESLLSSYRDDPMPFVATTVFNESHRLIVYNSLCKGNNPTYLAYGASLKCYLSYHRHPFHVLSPLKTEELSRYPKIYQFYDVINDKEVNQILGDIEQTVLAPDLHRDHFPDVNGTRDAPEVTSCSAVFNVDQMNSLSALEKTVRLLTVFGGGEDEAEDRFLTSLRVTEHVAGRYSLPQKVYENEEGFKDGDMISTIMFFLTTVDQGGETVFPTLEAVARPVKGSVVYWENMYRVNGGIDDVWYGTCPVARGQKIVLSTSKVFHNEGNAETGCQGWMDPYNEGDGFLVSGGGWNDDDRYQYY